MGHMIMTSFIDRTQSEILVAIVGIVEIMFAILAVIHVISCLWIGVGRSDWTGWVTRLDIDEKDMISQYAWSFHWTLANFHGTMEQVPGNQHVARMICMGRHPTEDHLRQRRQFPRHIRVN